MIVEVRDMCTKYFKVELTEKDWHRIINVLMEREEKENEERDIRIIRKISEATR
jgi:hypothetical protein